jgi:hypothetical protein
MNAKFAQRAFAEIGARFEVEEIDPGNDRAYTLDISEEHGRQYFLLRTQPRIMPSLDLQVLQKSREERHLLLRVKELERPASDRFLCGFDEREWFVAATPGRPNTIREARDELKPWRIRQREIAQGVRKADRQKRRNAVSVRQGEWFFLPEPGLVVPPAFIRRNEPISRGPGSKPHIVEEYYSQVGDLLYVHPKYPSGLSKQEMSWVLGRDQKLRREDFVARRRSSGVFVRGKVSHPDHRTIVLHEWHAVVMNTEDATEARKNVVFVD